MSTLSHPKSDKLQRWFSPILSGYLGGVAAALLDIIQATDAVSGPLEVTLVSVQAIGKLGVLGALLGLAGAVLAAVSNKVAKKFSSRTETLFALFATAAAAGFLIYVSIRLYSGGTMSRLPATWALKTVTAAATIGGFFFVTRFARKILIASTAGAMSRRAIIAVVLLLVGFSFAARTADAYLFKRLYLYLHTALGLVTLGGFALCAQFALAIRVPVATRNRFGFLVTLATALLVGAVLLINSRQNVKLACYNDTATLQDLLRATSFRSGRHKKNRAVAKKTKPKPEQRKRFGEARVTSQGSWPALENGHFLLITVDALRADKLGVYGHTARDLTPGIDGWARDRAVVFERAYATAPHSSYSISSLLTSRFVYDEVMLGQEIEHPTIADVLRGRGYTTKALYTQGIFFTEGDAMGHYRRTRFGFEDAIHGSISANELTDIVIEDIDGLVEQGEPPSLIWVHYFNVHEPYESTRFGDSLQDRYDGEIFDADQEIIRLIAYAEEKLKRGVVIFLTADHGEEFREHGGYYHGSSLYDEQVRVPFIVSFPKTQPGRVQAPVSTAAMVPTALRLLGVDPPLSMQGQDLRPAVFAGDDKHNALPVMASVMHQHMVVDWPWKLVVDPSKETFELYNLKTDPAERMNLYDHRRKVASKLSGSLENWMDEVSFGESDVQVALNLGHLRDPRALPILIDVARNEGALEQERIEAINLIGEMREYSAKLMLRGLLTDQNPSVALAAAFTLGELHDPSGTDILYDALIDADPAVNDRAGLVLGKLGDTAAVPALVEALGRDDVTVRQQAIRTLGNLRDPAAVEPLIDALAEERTQYLVVLALGKIGDPRAYEPLLDILEHNRHTNVRGYAVVALGWLELPKAAPRLIEVLRREPEIKWTGEALLRLGAVGESPLYGTDVRKGLPSLVSGFGRCKERHRIVPGEFLQRTTCKTTDNEAAVAFHAEAENGATLIVGARHVAVNPGREFTLRVLVDGKEVGRTMLKGTFEDHRIKTAPGTWRGKKHTVRLKLEAEAIPMELDHVMVLVD